MCDTFYFLTNEPNGANDGSVRYWIIDSCHLDELENFTKPLKLSVFIEAINDQTNQNNQFASVDRCPVSMSVGCCYSFRVIAIVNVLLLDHCCELFSFLFFNH